tara:strand:+ start:117 stop:416 length:300 start_codon:yes stop_codon:yes gene_type:complete
MGSLSLDFFLVILAILLRIRSRTRSRILDIFERLLVILGIPLGSLALILLVTFLGISLGMPFEILLVIPLGIILRSLLDIFLLPSLFPTSEAFSTVFSI